MAKVWQSVFFIGILTLAIVVTIFFYRTGPVSYGEYAVIDTDLNTATSGMNIAKTKISLNEQNTLNELPETIDRWTMVGLVPNEEQVKEWLQADVLLMRTYRQTLSSWPMFLTIVHAPTTGSIHLPELCYRGAGYLIEKTGKDTIILKDGSLVGKIEDFKPDTLGEWVFDKFGLPVSEELKVNALSVYKGTAEVKTERRMALYVYVKDMNDFSNEFTIVRVSTIIPVTGTHTEIEAELKDFMNHTLLSIFMPTGEESSRIIGQIIKEGFWGYILIIILLVIPVTMIMYPLLTRKLFAPRKQE